MLLSHLINKNKIIINRCVSVCNASTFHKGKINSQILIIHKIATFEFETTRKLHKWFNGYLY